MASRYDLIHHPAAAEDFKESFAYFANVDAGLAELFEEDFKAVLRGMASGRCNGTLYAEGSSVRWVKLRRFSHKVFFEPGGDSVRFVLAVVSGRRHPTRVRLTLSRRKKRK